MFWDNGNALSQKAQPALVILSAAQCVASAIYPFVPTDTMFELAISVRCSAKQFSGAVGPAILSASWPMQSSRSNHYLTT
jgi:hypothetical protein